MAIIALDLSDAFVDVERRGVKTAITERLTRFDPVIESSKSSMWSGAARRLPDPESGVRGAVGEA